MNDSAPPWIGKMRLTPDEKHLVEILRMRRRIEIETEPKYRYELEKLYGDVFDPEQFTARFSVLGFLQPFVVVRRRSDNALGIVEYQSFPRFYFNFREATFEKE